MCKHTHTYTYTHTCIHTPYTAHTLHTYILPQTSQTDMQASTHITRRHTHTHTPTIARTHQAGPGRGRRECQLSGNCLFLKPVYYRRTQRLLHTLQLVSTIFQVWRSPWKHHLCTGFQQNTSVLLKHDLISLIIVSNQRRS